MIAQSPAVDDIPVRIRFDYPQRMSRWLLWIKWLLVIPHWIALYIYGILVGLTTFIAWFAVIFSGRYPQGLFNFAVGYFRWSLRVQAYFPLLMTDRYPPFGEGEHAVQFEVDYPSGHSRGLAWLRFLMLLPVFPFFWLFFFGAYILAFPLLMLFYIILSWVWLCLLCVAEYPRGLYEFMAKVVAWQYRANIWWYFLRDDWRLFGTKGVVIADEQPAS